MPSRRHCLHFGERSRAIRGAAEGRFGWGWGGGNSYAAPLLLADAVVRLGRDVLDPEDLEPRRLEGANRRLAPGAGPLDEDLDFLQAVLHSLPGARVRRHLRGEGGRLARALEAGRAGALPADDVPFLVGEADDRVVEGRLD